jgi:hypothetical protein
MTRPAGAHGPVALALQLALEMTAFAEPMKTRLHTQHEVASRLAVASNACVRASAIDSVVMTGDAIRIAVKIVRKKQSKARVRLQRHAL